VPKEPKINIAARVPAPIVERLDALSSALSTEWHDASRSEVVRAALTKGIEALEAEAGQGRCKRACPSSQPQRRA
jgi:hypothetical protein